MDKDFHGQIFSPQLTHLLVKADNYETRYTRRDKDLIYLERIHRRDKPEREVDVYGDFWMIIFVEAKPEQVGFHTQGELSSLVGPWAIYIPRHSVIDWRMGAGVLKWSAYLCRSLPPSAWPKNATAMPWNAKLPAGREDIDQLIQRRSAQRVLEKLEHASSIATRAKEILDSHSEDDLKISEIAEQLALSHAQVTRQFQSCYGISPLEYRTTKRVLSALTKLAFQEESVIQTGFSVGFTDLSRFNKNFKKKVHLRPSQFRESAEEPPKPPLAEVK